MSCVLFTDSFLHVEMLGAIARGKFSPELDCQEHISMGRGIFPWRWSQVSVCHFKKTIRN